MDVFEVHGKIKVACVDFLFNGEEAVDDGVAVFFGEDADFFEHLRMGNRAVDVLVVHPLVKVDGGLEFIDHLVRGL